MERSIDEILSNETVTEPEAVVETVEQPEATTEAEPETAERPRGPDGKFIAKETGVETAAEPERAAEPVPPTEQSNQLPPAEYAALKDERRKRQDLEQRLQAMEQQFRQPAPQQQPQPPVDFWDDPQSFMDARLNQLGEQLLTQWEQKQQVQRINASEEAAKAKYPDYPDAYNAFEQAVQLNPKLAYELAQAPDPGEFCYSRGKTALEIQRVGSIDELRNQIRAELEAEARAIVAPVRPVLPSTTAADGSVGARTGPAWAGPRSIDDILRS
jgi:hypothetical protein